MTYLATEMLLYLLSAAVIGIAMGWFIWGSGQHRKLSQLRADLMKALKSKEAAEEEAELAIANVDTKMKLAVKETEVQSKRALLELQETCDAERQRAEAAEATVKELQAGVEKTLEQGRVSTDLAIDEAMRSAVVEKAAAEEAKAKEAQSRAQIEELRLLIGAEKLTANSAQAKLEKTRAEMTAELEAERAAHQETTLALEDIRSALRRTLGPDVFGAMAGDVKAVEADQGIDPDTLPKTSENLEATSGLMTGIAAAGETLSALDLDDADIGDQEDANLPLISTSTTQMAATQDLEPTEDLDVGDVVEAVSSAQAVVSDDQPTPAEPDEPDEPEQQAASIDTRPEQADDLTVIDGISSDIELRLHKIGYFRYGQLADLTLWDIGRLAHAIDITSEQISDERWIEQAKSLRAKADSRRRDSKEAPQSSDIDTANQESAAD